MASARLRRLRTPLVLVLFLATAGGGVWYWQTGSANEPPEYTFETVDRGPIAAVVTATGTVNPVTTVQVGTYVSGPIRDIDVDFNSPVRKGQRVAKIDPAPFVVKVERAEANLANARARIDKARADLALKQLTFDRNLGLRAKNLISQQDVDTARSNLDQARAQLALEEAGVKQAQADLDEARINLAYTDITSPVDGVVVSRNVDVGQTVAASFQTPTLFLIAEDLTRMQVNASVSESDIGTIHSDQQATFAVDAYPGKPFAGTVTQVRNAPITVQNVVTYDVIVEVDNTGMELKPGMTANVTIVTAERDDVLRVPLRALRFNPETTGGGTPTPRRDWRTNGTGSAVWVAQPDGELRRTDITTGLRDERFAEVLSGPLEAGTLVAVGRKPAARKTEGPRIPGAPRFR
ncbi:efflux RND transporter periplasmic adaptor subunit [Candidatus Binatia bacterium]|nr:efflux RND transporter periplasmic adaptor subunit [Candidatus Binatia bacterium]